MIDACLIEREASSTVDSVGASVRTYSTVYTGKCRFRQMAGIARPQNPGEAHELIVRRELQLPVSASGTVRAADIVTVTSAVNDPDLVGRTFVIWVEAAASEQTARRLGIDEATS